MNQSTYPPYMNYPNYSSNNSNNSPLEPKYAENIFNINRGKRVSIYLSYPDSVEWRDRVFTGKILREGTDYVMIEQDDGNIVLLWLVYINYAIFEKTASY